MVAPKGLYDETEHPLAARRSFTGRPALPDTPDEAFIPLGELKQQSQTDSSMRGPLRATWTLSVSRAIAYAVQWPKHVAALPGGRPRQLVWRETKP